MSLDLLAGSNPDDRRWSVEKINKWYSSKPWLIGCNYATSTAVNQLEMWEKETFDPDTINKELGWARGLGFNTIRVFLHHLLWDHDPEGLILRMEKFLGIAHAHHIGVMFVLFDGVWNPNPQIGFKQSIPGVHNSGWLQSPGAEILKDVSRHHELEAYVKGVLRHFSRDSRIHVWDLFNEPDNTNSNSYKSVELPEKAIHSFKLLKKCFAWAREINPSQPLTSGVWQGEWSEKKLTALDRYMLEASDVITFHNYENAHEIERRIKILRRFNRPIICTEYMARVFDSTLMKILPILKKYNVGGYNWGLVEGKTQTAMPWDSWLVKYESQPSIWFHDILNADGTPHIAEEVEFLLAFDKTRSTDNER